jgi:hypothetical protein
MNKKRIYLLSSIIFSIGLIAGLMQYVGIINVIFAENISPNPGHSWSEIECTDKFCINSNGSIGIGTILPSSGYKLDVKGKARFTDVVEVGTPTGDNHAATKKYVDDEIKKLGLVSPLPPLVGGNHSQAECIDLGGEVVDSDVSFKICRLDQSTCPSGWTAYKNFRTVGTEMIVPVSTYYRLIYLDCQNYQTSCFRSGGGVYPGCSCNIIFSTLSWGNNPYRCGTCYCACSACGSCNAAQREGLTSTQIGCY